ncbi:anthranilate synthase component I family protein [Metabacillus arenae]|uniref:Anthranilate synthase component I family protein n=1 Tax=Metabacillus arenae TaxID=2771434 RepID=A0A926RYQ0_9BACI|nr:anthranilate synthase component I family protein [Metabacillus arenae]MBD1383193.1 anthranilate synthase component I family protein [Metabacillus arenae]
MVRSKRKPKALCITYSQDFFKQYQFLTKDKSYHVLLESGRGGRYHIAGIDPQAIFKAKNGTVEIRNDDGNVLHQEGDPFDLFEEWIAPYRSLRDEAMPDFQGGVLGFIGYDSVRYFEKLPNISADDLLLPDLYFLLFNEVAVYDQLEGLLWLITHSDQPEDEQANQTLQEMKKLWTTEPSVVEYIPDASYSSDRKLAFTEQTFMDAVEQVKEYIAQGDVFQVNLSIRQEKQTSLHPMKVYETLRRINPSPYMGYLHFPEFQIACGSPELLVKKEGEKASTRPIAGTRSRGVNDDDDTRLANVLIKNEKECAEHVMLVDLERNDLGRICEYGSVEVNEFMTIEKYSHVMHIVSNVQGKLSKGTNFKEIVRATFPGGTITGAPKVRTMEIIEELEPTRRGLYTGSIGWVGFNEDVELNIVIRTLLFQKGKAFMQSGAGIVIDSNPKHEYKESLKKATAMLKALELSEEENMNL